MSEDELGDALLLVRRARNKYSTLHRRQSSATVAEVGRRAATQSQNLRTLRKAEIFEDALARVSRAYANAAKAAAAQIKSERLALAKAATVTAPTRSMTKLLSGVLVYRQVSDSTRVVSTPGNHDSAYWANRCSPSTPGV